MLKADRDQIMANLQDESRKQFRQFIDDYRARRKSASGGRVPAREMLDELGADLSWKKKIRDRIAPSSAQARRS